MKTKELVNLVIRAFDNIHQVVPKYPHEFVMEGHSTDFHCLISGYGGNTHVESATKHLDVLGIDSVTMQSRRFESVEKYCKSLKIAVCPATDNDWFRTHIEGYVIDKLSDRELTDSVNQNRHRLTREVSRDECSLSLEQLKSIVTVIEELMVDHQKAIVTKRQAMLLRDRMLPKLPVDTVCNFTIEGLFLMVDFVISDHGAPHVFRIAVPMAPQITKKARNHFEVDSCNDVPRKFTMRRRRSNARHVAISSFGGRACGKQLATTGMGPVALELLDEDIPRTYDKIPPKKL